MPNFMKLSVLGLLLLGLVACQDSGSVDATVSPDSPTSAVALFDKEMSKQGCELLSAELVGKTFDVPADALRQMRIAGCRYDWSNEQETIETGVSMIKVHKSEASAASWFESATRNRTAEEMKAEMERVAGRLDKREELDTDLKKATANNLLAMIGTKAESFEDVTDVGDEARVSSAGTVYVRKGNLTFMVTAYKGAKAPPLNMQGVEINRMAQVAKESSDRWAIETTPQRKTDATRLARAIVGGL